jgi:hypothetical protein
MFDPSMPIPGVEDAVLEAMPVCDVAPTVPPLASQFDIGYSQYGNWPSLVEFPGVRGSFLLTQYRMSCTEVPSV